MKCAPLPQHAPDLPRSGAVADLQALQVNGREVGVQERLVLRQFQISAVLVDDLEVTFQGRVHRIAAEAIVSLVYVDDGARYGGADKVSSGQSDEQGPVLGSG